MAQVWQLFIGLIKDGLLFFNDVINKALNDKGGISRDEMREIGKKVLYSKPEGEHERLKNDLLKSGIDFRE